MLFHRVVQYRTCKWIGRSGDHPLDAGHDDAIAGVAAERGAVERERVALTSMTTGFLNPIPHETTKAQMGTGVSSTDPIIFDLSGPIGGRPGETLVAWILTLPQEETFARHGLFHIVSQSRKDLVQDVDNYPDAAK